MYDRTIQRINYASFVTSLSTIVAGVLLGVGGVWGVVPMDHGLLWKLLGSDVIVFAGGVLTNLAIACYHKPGGAMAG